MNFNIEETLNEMLSVMRGVAKEHWKDMESISMNFFNRKKERLEMLAKMRISGEITQARFESRLEDEKLILEAELNALATLSKAITQKAINGAIDVLEKAVAKAVGAIL
jgi:uncharacterized protein YdaU (DUF1376 family)